MKKLLKQIKARRLQMGLRQKDMYMRIGLSRQQYQQIESKGNPSLTTLELIALGLNSEIMLIPKEMIQKVNTLLKQSSNETKPDQKNSSHSNELDNPWEGLLDHLADD